LLLRFDCLIPVSGGKDSTYQILKARSLGIKPLCLFVDTGHLSKIGQRNLNNLENFNINFIHFKFDKKISNTLSKIGLLEVGDIEWLENVAINTVTLWIAIKLRIDKILWGENSQSEYGGPKNMRNSKVMFHRQWFLKFGGTLNLNIKKIEKKYRINNSAFEYLQYPKLDQLKNIKAYFLGYFFEWDSFNNFEFAKKRGFKAFDRRLSGSLLKYENIDNYLSGIHDYFKYLKTGMGRVHDQVSRLIRRKKISIYEGKKLIKKYDGELPHEYTGVKIEKILNEINISKQKFNEICFNYTNEKLFIKKKLSFGKIPKKKFSF
jgi:N-acetyl sugar amidotransferase